MKGLLTFCFSLSFDYKRVLVVEDGQLSPRRRQCYIHNIKSTHINRVTSICMSRIYIVVAFTIIE